ncbi:hypothetical protein RND71_044191 [Anisodus tanguticus]|uniref:GH18 domain-containing protein n=1 Tax=Anisodus tanguticus TaxID=243964 RepID=A0AAE1UTR4_9SOLA|nr:hypothetical protein RND71_044191 [Anisodus tanguticus]
MASNKYNRRVFTFSAMDYLRERNFDGLDIDWEFPKELKEAFEAEAKEKKEKRLLLTVAVSAGVEAIKTGYDVPGIAAKTGHNAPLYASANETDWRKQLSVDFGVKMWEKLGAPKDKIVVGMGTYGRSFTLSNLASYGMNVPTSGGGTAGEYTKESGFLAFYEICQMLKDGATYFWDDEQKVPYAVKGDQWVGFDDERSIEEKMNWLISNDYAGSMVWTIDMDDFLGQCSGVKYPLLNIMAHYMFGKPIPAGSQISNIVKKAMAHPLNTPVASSVIVSSNTNDVKIETAQTDLNANSTIIDKDATNARVVCYYTNWSRKRPGAGKFEIKDIDPMLCTHVIYAFAGLKDNKIEPTEENDEENFKQLVALKEKNPNLKILLAIGGWMVGPQPFRTLTENVYRQTLFTFSVIEYLRAKGFDGLDLCWEMLNWEQTVGHNSPLFALNGANNYHKKLTVDYSVSEWHRRGANKEKLVVGMPTYGRTFTLPTGNLTDIGAPALKGGNPGQFTKETGFLSFFEICDLLKMGATLVWDNEQMVPYAYKDDQWVGFDDPRSFKIKVQWLKQAGYGGIMIWSIDMDDFKGTCMGINYPLINSAKEELKGYKVPNLETQSSLLNAVNKQSKRKHHMPCPQNLVFNINENVCDWPENVEDCSTALAKPN